MISKHHKMAEVIHLDYHLLSVLYRFNINLGFGEKTVEQVCFENQINPDFFIEIVKVFVDKNYFPDKALQSFSTETIISYLQASHQYYINEKIPELQRLFKDLLTQFNSPKNLTIIEQFFSKYINEFLAHINREETVVFPYIKTLEKITIQKKTTQQQLEDTLHYNIDTYANEHEDVQEKLADLQNILIKYIPPLKDYKLTHLILAKLFRLGKDLNDHSNLEDKVLITKVRKTEQTLKTLIDNQSIEFIS